MLAATKAEVQDTLAMLDHQKAEQIWFTYRQLYRNFATVCKEFVDVQVHQGLSHPQLFQGGRGVGEQQ